MSDECGCKCTGATSNKGNKGNPGDTGATGPDGLNGMRILGQSSDSDGSKNAGVLTTETAMFSHLIGAAELSNNGDEVEYFCFYKYANNDPVTVRFKLNGLTIYTLTKSNTVDEYGTIRVKINKEGVGVQLWTIENQWNEIGGANGSGSNLDMITSAEDEAVIMMFQVTAQNTAGGGPQFIVYKSTLYKNTL
jgi:hypothetical protein